jgi:hypothetical protein
MPKNAKIFVCELCDFKCSKKSNFIIHKNTLKHINGNKMITNDNKKMPKNAKYLCKCGNIYKYISGLSRHKKVCQQKIQTQENDENEHITKELIINLIKDNNELKHMMLKVLENNTTQNINSNNSLNTNNTTFNLNFFLNETCKNAMNITEFIDSIKLQLSDLEKMGELGYVEGISDIITSNLKALDVSIRPVHCTDKKRETIYVKDENKWKKEDDNNTRLRKLINNIANKNIKLLSQYKEKYPEYKNSSSFESNKYSKIVIETMGGLGENNIEKENKIIHNISKCITIEKYN